MESIKSNSMISYILESQKVLQTNISELDKVTQDLRNHYYAGNHEQIILVASGSSYNACNCVLSLCNKLMPNLFRLITPGEILYGDVRLDTTLNPLCVLVSQSGCSTNIIDAAVKLSKQGFVTASLTANLDSDLPNYAETCFDLGCGNEIVRYVTKGVYCLSLYILGTALFIALAEDSITQDELTKYLNSLTVWAQSIPELFELSSSFFEAHKLDLIGSSAIYLMGFSSSLAAAREGALKLTETVKIPALAFETEEFHHGPSLALNSNTTLFFLDDFNCGQERTYESYQALKSVTNRCYYIGDIVTSDKTVIDLSMLQDINPEVKPLVLIPILHALSYYIAQELNSWKTPIGIEVYRKALPNKTQKVESIALI